MNARLWGRVTTTAVLVIGICIFGTNSPSAADSQDGISTPGNTQKVMIAILQRITERVRTELPGKSFLAGGSSTSRYYVVQVETLLDAGYDVRATNSLVSPYIGIITFMAQVKSNIWSPKADGQARTAFSTPAAALAAKDPTDFVPFVPGFPDRPEHHRAQGEALYSYQDEHWVLKSITGADFPNMFSDN
jgi:hypothetical protein